MAKSINTIAQEVIRGKWGNGNTRKQRLTKAGYSYSQVQKRVNEILGHKSSKSKSSPSKSTGSSSSSKNGNTVDEAPLSISNISKSTDGTLDDLDTFKVKFSVTWKFSDKSKDTKKNKRHITKIGVVWDWILPNGQTKRISGKYVKVDVTSDELALTRKYYYPSGGGPYKGIRVKVFGANASTTENNAPSKTATYSFAQPEAPTTKISYDSSAKSLSFSYTSDIDASDTKSRNERYETKSLMTRQTYISGKKENKTIINNKVSTDKSLTYGPYPTSTDPTPINPDDYVLYTFIAKNLGFYGDSKKPSVEYKDLVKDSDEKYIFSHPSIPTITSIERVGNNVAVYVDTNKKSMPEPDALPHETIKLYKAQATLETYETTDVENLSWSEVSGASGDVDTKVLIEPITSALKVDRGKYTWYRVMSERGIFSEVSKEVRADILFSPAHTAVDSTVSIDSVSVNSDGTSVTLSLSWSSVDDAEGTEISYSLDEDAWDIGSKTPSTVTLLDKNAESDGSTTYKLSGLKDGSLYYIRARRYLESDKSYGPYTGTFSVTPYASIADQSCAITEYKVFKGNESMIVVADWNSSSSSTTVKTGTQFLWSSVEDPIAKSTNSPSTYDIDDEDTTSTNTQLTIHSINAGNTTYLRARRYQYSTGDTDNKIYSSLYSDLIQVPITAEDDICGIISINENEDGESLKVTVGWNEDDSTGTEISWSTKSYAWNSSESVSTFDVSWDGISGEDNGYLYKTDVIIGGLTSGTQYYLRARRYQSGSPDTYGPYTAISSATPYAAPKNLIVNSDTVIAKGDELSIAWSFSSDSEQTSFMIFDRTGVSDDAVDENGNIVNGDNIATQETYENSYTISSDIIEKYSVNDIFAFAVVVVTGGGSIQSSTIQVQLVNAPTCKVSMNSTTTDESTGYAVVNSVKSISFTINSTINSYDYICRLVAFGSSITLPDKTYYQEEGDILWNETLEGTSLAWTANDDGSYSVSYTVPDTIDDDTNYLVDYAYYQIQVYAMDPESGLVMSDPAETIFRVIYGNKAHALSEDTNCVPEDGLAEVSITPILSSENRSDDQIYIYRHTAFGDVLIGKNVTPGVPITDKFAPYYADGDMYYIIMVKSSDGDIQYMEVPYYIKRTSVRFDWGKDRYVEIPYNLKISDSISKNFEKRTYLDGTSSGFWSKGYDHTSSISSQVFRVRDIDDFDDENTEFEQNEIMLIRELAVYDGPVFVRCPDGSAYEADVEVSGLNYSYDSLNYDISIKTTEVGLTDEFMLHYDDEKSVDSSNIIDTTTDTTDTTTTTDTTSTSTGTST